MGIITSFIAGCGGAGKTTAVMNLGVLLAAGGRRVLMVDGAAGLPDLDVSLGRERDIRFNADDVICGRCTPEEALVPIPGTQGRLWLLPAAPTEGESSDGAAIAIICRNLAPSFDHVFIDAPPGNEAGLVAAASAAPIHVLVAQHTVQHRRGCEAILARLQAIGALGRHPLVLFNRVTPQRASAAGATAADLLLSWGLEEGDVIGSIPEDEAVIATKHHGTPLVMAAPDSPAARAYAAAGKRLRACLTEVAAEQPAEAQCEEDGHVPSR